MKYHVIIYTIHTHTVVYFLYHVIIRGLTTSTYKELTFYNSSDSTKPSTTTTQNLFVAKFNLYSTAVPFSIPSLCRGILLYSHTSSIHQSHLALGFVSSLAIFETHDVENMHPKHDISATTQIHPILGPRYTRSCQKHHANLVLVRGGNQGSPLSHSVGASHV